MTTFGDLLYNARAFATLKRTQKLQNTNNPILIDNPPGGEYALRHDWKEQRIERIGLQSAWVYSAIRKISMAALPAKVEIKQRVGKDVKDIDNHPLEVLLNFPNVDMSREFLWMFTHFSMQLSGKAFWLLYPDSQGNIAEVWPMPHYLVRPVADASENPDRLFSHYVYSTSNGEDIKVPIDNVVYLRFPDPLNPYEALSPLAAGGLAVLLDRAQQGWNTKTFDKESGLPTSLTTVSESVTPADFTTIKADLKRHHGKNMVVRSNTIDVKRLAMTNEEAQYLESRNFNKEEIYNVFGVPFGGDTDGGIKELNRAFVNQTVWPLLEFIAGEITTYIVRPFYGDDMFATFSDIRPQDRALAVQEATQYWPVYTLNETRVERDLAPLSPLVIETDDGDKLNLWDDVPIKQLDTFAQFLQQNAPELPEQNASNNLPGAPSLQDAQSPAATQVQDDEQSSGVDDEEEEDDRKSLKARQAWKTKSIVLSKKGGAATPFFDETIPECTSYTMAAVLGLCHSAAEIKAVFKEFKDWQSPEAIKAVLGRREDVPQERLDLEDEFVPSMSRFLAAQSGRISDTAQVQRNIPDGEFWKNEDLLLLAMLTPFTEIWTEQGISDIVTNSLAPVGLGIDANVNARAATWAGNYALDLAKGLNKTTKEIAKAKIKNWLQTGKPFDTLVKDLSSAIAPRWRAELIASTEITKAWGMAAQEVAKEYDVIKTMVWNTANDELVCPICGELDGEEVKVGSMFTGGLDGPPAHPRCRCGLAFGV